MGDGHRVWRWHLTDTVLDGCGKERAQTQRKGLPVSQLSPMVISSGSGWKDEAVDMSGGNESDWV